MMKRLLVGFLLGILATIGLAAQTPVAMCPRSGALNVYVSMGAGGCSVGTLTFSNFSYSYSQTVGATTTTAPSSYNLSPYTGPNGTGLTVDTPLQTAGSADIHGEIFTLIFDVSPNNGTAISGNGFIVSGLGGNASAEVRIDGPVFPEGGYLAVSCSADDIEQICNPHLDGCLECPVSAQHETTMPMPSGQVIVGEAAYCCPSPGVVPGAVGPLALTFDETPVITPEPATWLLFGTGLLLMLGLVARARRNERIAE